MISAIPANSIVKDVLQQEDEIMQYIRRDTSGMLESFYYDYMEDGGEWFLFERDNGIIVRQKIDHEKYLYCYYQFPCEGKLYGSAIRAYGKNEDCYFISWEDNDYLAVTRREEGQVMGIAVYQRYSAIWSEWYNSRPTGWIMGLEKTFDGEIQVTLYTYVYAGGAVWGSSWIINIAKNTVSISPGIILKNQGDIFMGQSMVETVMKVKIVTISFILAFLTYQGIAPEKFIKSDSTHLAGEDTPRLSGREEFEALVGTDPVTVEPEEVVATGVYGLKPWVNPSKITRTAMPNGRTVNTGRRAPDATDNAITAVEHYQEFYLIRLPDQTYILAQFDRIYRAEIEKGGAV